MPKISKRGGRAKAAPFVKLDRWFIQTAAWRDLNTVARCLYVELRSLYNGANNGTISLGAREAGERLNISKNTASRGFDDLVSHGFIVVATGSSFGQKRLTREWLLTEERDDRNGNLPLKTFVWWGHEKQKPVPYEGRIVPLQGQQRAETAGQAKHSTQDGTVFPDSDFRQSHLRYTHRSTMGGTR